MKCEQVKHQLIDYIDGQVSDNTREAIDGHLSHCNACQEEYIKTGQLLNQMAEQADEEPSTNLRSGFYQMLEAEKSSLHVKPLKPTANRISFKYYLNYGKVAAQIILLVGIGVIIGSRIKINNQQSAELAALKSQVNEMQTSMSLVSLSEPTASQRLKAINLVNKQPKVNDELMDALITTMNNDKSVNVRMAAIYALAEHKTNEKVKLALIQSLNQQTDPLLQITLINILAKMQDERAKQSLQLIMESNSVQDVVKQQATNGLKSL